MAGSDDMYPNQGDHLSGQDLEAWAPAAPEERSETEKEELLKIASSAAVIQDVMQWLDTSITFYGDMDSIDEEGQTDETLKESIHIAKGMRREFRNKYKEFAKLYAEVLKAKEVGSHQ